MLADKLPRVRLATLPTPIERLPRLGAHLGLELWVKRDDLTGLAGGGNKTRKLEFSAGEALERGCDTLITMGAVQSNHCRQTAAAAARLGLRCILVIRGPAPAETRGNLLLDFLLGAQLRFTGDRTREEVAAEVFSSEARSGRKPFLIPIGASDEYGAVGYAAAVEELAEQMAEDGLTFDRVVLASSSFGTQVGLCLGNKALGLGVEIAGVSIDHEAADLREGVSRIARATARRLGLDVDLTPDEVVCFDGYLGGGYSVMGESEREAILMAARFEGLLLDPVYTGRAMAGLIDLTRSGVIRRGERILFWHTGGAPALEAYAEGLTGRPSPDAAIRA
jgi:L-cysteate sulfo-lyase